MFSNAQLGQLVSLELIQVDGQKVLSTKHIVADGEHEVRIGSKYLKQIHVLGDSMELIDLLEKV